MLRTVFLVLMSLMLAATAAAFPSDLDIAAQTLREAAGPNRLVLLGEKHGTREIPDLVAKLASAWSEEGPLLLALEIHRGNQPALRRYLASDGGAHARGALAASRFWKARSDQHDGRRSQDMLDLVEHVRALKAQGRDIFLLAYDVDPTPSPLPDREQRMAARIAAAHAALPQGRLLVLSGNVHAMLKRPDHAPPQLPVPMGYWLRELAPYSVDIVASRGAFWACRQTCGPMAIQVDPGAGGPLSDGVHHRRVVLPRFTVGRLLGAGVAASATRSPGSLPES